MLTVDKTTNRATIACNSCPATFTRDIEPLDVPATVQSAKADRWSIERHAGLWQHYCPACVRTRMRGKLL